MLFQEYFLIETVTRIVCNCYCYKNCFQLMLLQEWFSIDIHSCKQELFSIDIVTGSTKLGKFVNVTCAPRLHCTLSPALIFQIQNWQFYNSKTSNIALFGSWWHLCVKTDDLVLGRFPYSDLIRRCWCFITFIVFQYFCNQISSKKSSVHYSKVTINIKSQWILMTLFWPNS